MPVEASQSLIKVPDWRDSSSSKLEEGKVESAPVPPPERHFDFTIRPDISVRNMRIGHADTTAMILALKASSHTRAIHLHNSNLSADQIYALGRALPHTQVRTLHIDFNPLPDCVIVMEASVPSSAPAAAVATSRTSRPTSSSAATRDAAAAASVAAAAAAAATPAAPLEPKRVHVFAALLRRGAQALSRLSLRGNGFRPLDAAFMAEQLRFNNTVTELMLAHNALGDDGAAMLLDAVRDNRSLATISLAANRLTSACVHNIAEAVGTFTLSGSQAKVRNHMESRVIGELLADAATAAATGSPFVTAAAPGVGSNAATAAGATTVAVGGAVTVPTNTSASVATLGDTMKKGGKGKEEGPDPADAFRLPALRLVSAGGSSLAGASASGAAAPGGASSTTPRAGAPTGSSTAAKGAKKEANAPPPGLPHVLPLPSEEHTAVYAGEGNHNLSCVDVSCNPDIGVSGLVELAHLFTPPSVLAAQGAASPSRFSGDAEDSVDASFSPELAAVRSRATSQGSVSRASDEGAASRRGSASAMGAKVTAVAARGRDAVPTLSVPQVGSGSGDGGAPTAGGVETAGPRMTLVAAQILPAPSPWASMYRMADTECKAEGPNISPADAAVLNVKDAFSYTRISLVL